MALKEKEDACALNEARKVENEQLVQEKEVKEKTNEEMKQHIKVLETKEKLLINSVKTTTTTTPNKDKQKPDKITDPELLLELKMAESQKQ